MTPWIRVSPEGAQENQHEGSIETRIETSPYNMPIALRACYFKAAEGLRIQFRYLDRDEPVLLVQRDDKVRLVVGQHSKRIVGIEIHLTQTPTSDQVLQALRSSSLSNALKKERITVKDKNAKENYSIIEKILATNTQNIVREVVENSSDALE